MRVLLRIGAVCCALCALFLLAFARAGGAPNAPRIVRVASGGELRAALNAAQPGTQILLAPGVYPGGYFCRSILGEPGSPVVITAQDAKNPPIIRGGSQGFQFAGTRYLEIRDLRIEGIAGNALAIDDAGVRDRPAHHIVVERVRFADMAPTGNYQAIKMAGVDDFQIRDCGFERWSGGSGMAIDGVGCHRGIVEGNRFKGRTAPDTRSFGAIQFKGASRDITIRRNRFENVGLRGINIGGSTGVPYFRPPLESWPTSENRYESKDIRVEGNTFIGGDAAVAFVNVDGATVRFNTLYLPERWALRILQETRLTGFGPSRNGVFSDNLIVFDTSRWNEGGVNIGARTAAATFTFARNFWYAADAPARSRPALPVGETGGVYGIAPQFRDAPGGDLRQIPTSPAKKFGADALPAR